MATYKRRINKIQPSMGVYIGTVMNTADVNFSGRLDVQIPSLQVTNDASDRALEKTTYTVRYCSPFAGQTPARDAKSGGGFEDTQKSYGFWAVPPDIGTQVLVMFANGNVNEGFWIGCVPDMQINHMVPGLASSEKSTEEASEGEEPKFGKLGITDLPVAEANRKTSALNINSDYTEDKSASSRPVHTHIADALLAQGLIKDKIRGVTSSSARRETPSQVFGISTPGPIDHKGQFAPQNTEAVNRHGEVGGKFAHSRLGGHSFVMDDGTPSVGGETPIENELIRFRTRKGAQVLLHDSENTVYIINSTGTAWVELSEDGKIDMYADESFSVHTIGDFNLRAERDINIEAARNINMKASGQNTTDQFINSNEDITTGRIHMDAKEDIEMIAELNIKQKAGVNFELFTVAEINQHAGTNMHLHTGTDLKLKVEDNFLVYAKDEIKIEVDGADSTGTGALTISAKTSNTLITGDSKIQAGKFQVFGGTNIDLDATAIDLNSGNVDDTLVSTATVDVDPFIENVHSDVVIQLSTFENAITSDAIDKTTKAIKRQSIMKRVPTAEPYLEHENLRKVFDEESGALKEDKAGIIFTDREIIDERFTVEEEEEEALLTGPAELGATAAGAGAVSIPAGGITDAAGSVTSAVSSATGAVSSAVSGAVSGAGVDLASIASAVSTASRLIAVGPEGILSEASNIVSAGLEGGIVKGKVSQGSANFIGPVTSQYSSKNFIKSGGGYLKDASGKNVTRGQSYGKFFRKGQK